MGSIEFIINGDPQGKGRPKHTKNGHTYTPTKTRAYEEEVKTAYVFAGGTKLGGYIKADILITYDVPKSYTKKDKQAITDGTKLPDKKPDIDNIIKIIFDALNGYAYDDDKQIIEVKANKVYGKKPSVKVRLETIDEDYLKVGGTE